jgi:hypothetical protein
MTQCIHIGRNQHAGFGHEGRCSGRSIRNLGWILRRLIRRWAHSYSALGMPATASERKDAVGYSFTGTACIPPTSHEKTVSMRETQAKSFRNLNQCRSGLDAICEQTNDIHGSSCPHGAPKYHLYKAYLMQAWFGTSEDHDIFTRGLVARQCWILLVANIRQVWSIKSLMFHIAHV